MVLVMPDWVDPRALAENVIIFSILAMACVGFVAGLKELIMDLRNMRRAKV